MVKTTKQLMASTMGERGRKTMESLQCNDTTGYREQPLIIVLKVCKSLILSALWHWHNATNIAYQNLV